MPYLATTRLGVAHFLALPKAQSTLWLGEGVISPDEIDLLREQGNSVSVFVHPVRSSDEVEDAAPTLREHHPNEPLWVEPFPEGSNPRSSDIVQAFLWREPLIGSNFEHNAFVQVVTGPHSGKRGSLVSIITLVPEPTYILEFESGVDVEVKQSCLRGADA